MTRRVPNCNREIQKLYAMIDMYDRSEDVERACNREKQKFSAPFVSAYAKLVLRICSLMFVF